MLSTMQTETTMASQRAHQRIAFEEACLIKTETRALHGRCHDISEGGACFTLQGLGTLQRGEHISLSIHTHAPVFGVVRWVNDRKIGVQFLEGIADHSALAEMIDRLTKGAPEPEEAPKVETLEPSIPMKEIIAWVKGLEDV